MLFAPSTDDIVRVVIFLILMKVVGLESPLKFAAESLLSSSGGEVELVCVQVGSPVAVRFVRAGGAVWQLSVVALPPEAQLPIVVVPFREDIRIFVSVVLAFRFIVVARGIWGVIVVDIFEVAVIALEISPEEEFPFAKRSRV